MFPLMTRNLAFLKMNSTIILKIWYRILHFMIISFFNDEMIHMITSTTGDGTLCWGDVKICSL